MDSNKSLSNLSISSIVPDNNPSNEDAEVLSKSNHMTKLLIDAVSTTNAEYTALANEKFKLLSTLGFNIKSQPSDIKEGLQTVSVILKSEALPSVDEDALQICLEEKNFYNMDKEREEKILKAKYNATFAIYSAMQDKVNLVKKEIEKIEILLEPDDEEISDIKDVMLSKVKDYKETVKKLEKELQELNVKVTSMDEILQKSSILTDNLNTLEQLDSNLEEHGDLPPNLLHAKNILNSKRKELEEIQNSILEKMNQ